MKTNLDITKELINSNVKNAYVYYHKESIWLIFPDTKKWVIEIMCGKTLWYNYEYFKHLFKVIGLGFPESEIFVTKWVEEVFKCSLKNSWSNIIPGELDWSNEFNPEEVIRETKPHYRMLYNPMNFEPTIKEMKRMNEVNIVLENSIKETNYCELHSAMSGEHIIRDGIKETNWRRVDNHPTYLDNIIKSNH